MKNIKFLALALVLLSACKKESTTAPGGLASVTTTQKTAATRPFFVDFTTTVDTDPSIPPTACSGDLPGLANAGYFLHGTATHMGSLISLQSRGQDVTCNLSFATALLYTTVAGQIAAADGDLIYYTGIDTINVYNLLTSSGTTGVINGLWTITGGTGKFTGASGSFPISGLVDFTGPKLSFKGMGSITY
jgi:hypothetical protein